MTSPAGRILGNYQLGDPIGRGGASEVFAATHRFLGHEVAIKLLRADLPGGEPATGAVDDFLGEAARARAVRHPNLVAVLDFGRDDASGRCYLVMERIPGESLAERLRRAGRLAEPDVRALGAALADAMQAAHDGGIVHRDLKPANVMLRGDQPTVVDFGLARDLGGQSALETGRRVGTPAYMAPEQLTGGLIAPCVDIWALGVILFEAVTGKLPFEGFADGRCPQLFESAPRASSLAPLSPELDALVAACLERSPGRRPAAMAAVARALRGEGDERVTQDVGGPVVSAGADALTRQAVVRGVGPVRGVDAQPAVGAPPGRGALSEMSAPPAIDAPSGMTAPPGTSVAPRTDPLDRRGVVPGVDALSGPTAPRTSGRRSGDSTLKPPRARIPPTPATASDAGLRRRRGVLVVLAASGALAGFVALRAVGGEPSSGPSTLGVGAAEHVSAAPEAGEQASPVGGMASEAREPARLEAARRGNLRADARSAAGGDRLERPSAAATPGAAEPLAIDIRSTPPGADVLVDGERRGRTPLHLQLPGPGRVLLRKRGYRSAAVRVERAGLLDVHLTRRPRSRPASKRADTKQPAPPRREGLD